MRAVPTGECLAPVHGAIGGVHDRLEDKPQIFFEIGLLKRLVHHRFAQLAFRMTRGEFDGLPHLVFLGPEQGEVGLFQQVVSRLYSERPRGIADGC